MVLAAKGPDLVPERLEDAPAYHPLSQRGQVEADSVSRVQLYLTWCPVVHQVPLFRPGCPVLVIAPGASMVREHLDHLPLGSTEGTECLLRDRAQTRSHMTVKSAEMARRYLNLGLWACHVRAGQDGRAFDSILMAGDDFRGSLPASRSSRASELGSVCLQEPR